MVITNNASSFERYNYCWDEKNKENWIHPQDPIAIKENKYNVFRFHEAFKKILDGMFKNEKACYISGVRVEESPSRYMGLTSYATYKWITWGKILNRKQEHYSFYPLYDWSYTDIWKYINDNKIRYNKVYDEMYKYGQNIKEMRISNLHHETALHHLEDVQKIEPETWDKIVKRIGGANTVKMMKNNSFNCPAELPNAFKTWKEYAEYLNDNLVNDKNNREELSKMIKMTRGKKGCYENGDTKLKNGYYRVIINTILSNDWDFTRLKNWEDSPVISHWRKYEKASNK